jgi:alkanesulfonate monooxygenase SsuD/methylene tetrahydromethanopterin reductase-like flavin-dependent oxidoreductase (luciferase family)
MVPLSVLDLAPVRAGMTATEALREAVDLARHTERLGYTRYWFAEHHGMASIASSAPEILIEHVASATSRIRVGSGGIMLPNHTPLRVAEAFHTLAALHPGRIDLGLGRAPGTDPATSRYAQPTASGFPAWCELLALSPHVSRASVWISAWSPPTMELPPVWVLGSSGAMAPRSRARSDELQLRAALPARTTAAGRSRVSQALRAPSCQFPSSRDPGCLGDQCTDRGGSRVSGRVDRPGLGSAPSAQFAPLPSPEEAIIYQYSPQGV